MPSVDDRIVEMQFDNKQFEQKLATTMGSLDNLKKKLDFANASKSFGDLQKAGNNLNFAGLTSAIEGISGKFSAMGAVAFTVLQNITNRVVDAGIQLGKSLSLDQVISGFREYETNMNSIQTILSNTKADGTNLEQVSAALDQLNTYADQTIYNFSEMARNIGTFTAAGVDLDTSVTAIKGIANLAAISGSNSQQASTAMYQLSQALASGTVKLMDWNSVVNAGMGGEVFQRALFETGKALGTIKDVPLDQTFDEWKDAGNSFRASLEDGWITAEVLTNTLQGFTGDLTDAQLQAMGYTEDQIKEIQELGKTGKAAATEVKTLTQLIDTVRESVGSGWSQSFRIVFGDFEEAKTLFTGLSDAIGTFVGNQSDARNELLQGWSDLGGRTELIRGLQIAFEAISRVIKPISEAFRNIFPKKTAQDLFNLTMDFQNFARRLRISGETADKIRTIFSGVFAALEIGWTIIKEGAKVVGELFSAFTSQNGSGILDFFADLASKIAFFNGALVAGGGIEQFFDGLVEAIKNPKEALQELKDKVTEFFSGIDFGSVDGIVEAFDRLKDAVGGLIDKVDPDILDGISGFFKKITDNFDPKVTNSMEGGFGRLGNVLGFFGRALETAGNVLGRFWDAFKRVGDFISGAISGLIDGFTNLGPSILDALKNADWELILDYIQTGIAGIFAGGFSNISKDGLKFDFTGGALSEIGNFFKGLDLKEINKSLEAVTGTLEAMQTKLKAEALQKIAIALGILAASMVVLSTIDPVALAAALTAIGIGFAELASAMAILTKVVSGPKTASSLAVTSGAMIALASALLILSVAVKILSTMSLEELAKGLGGVLVLLGAIAGVVAPLSANSSGMVRAGAGILAIAISLNILVAAVKLMSTMSWEEMIKGLVGVVALLGALTLAVKPLSANSSGMVKAGAGILLISVALNLLATAMKLIATMSWEEIGKGLIGVAVGLGLIVAAMRLMGTGKNMLSTGAGILAITFGLNLLATAMKVIATMSWEDIAKGLVTIAGALIIFAVAGKAMAAEGLPGAVAISLISVSLMLLAKALKEFAKLSWKELIKGLAALAGTLLVLGGVSYVLAPLVVSMIGLGAAMLAIGAGAALFGLGASLIAKAFETIASAGKAGIDVVLYAIDELVKRLPEIAKSFAEGLVEVAKILIDAGPELIAGLSKIVGSLLQLVIDNIPKFADTFLTFIHEGLRVIREAAPDFVATGLAVLLAFLQGIRDNIAEITNVVVDIITNFLDALALRVPDIIDSVYNLIIAVIEGVIEKLADIASFLVPKGVELLDGLWNGIKEKAVDVYQWFAELPGNVVKKIGDVTKRLLQKGKDFIIGLKNGFENKWEEFKDFVLGIPAAILDFLPSKEEALRLLYDIGVWIMEGLYNGLVSMKDKVLGFFGGIGSSIKSKIADVLGVHSPSTVMYEIGVYVGEGLVNGMAAMESDIIDVANRLGNAMVDGVVPDATQFKTLRQNMNYMLTTINDSIPQLQELTPTITPVIDLANVEAGARRLGSIIENTTYAVLRPAGPSYQLATILSNDVNTSAQEAATTDTQATREVTYIQNNYSPESLSTADIYRRTQNQVAVARGELAAV